MSAKLVKLFKNRADAEWLEAKLAGMEIALFIGKDADGNLMMDYSTFGKKSKDGLTNREIHMLIQEALYDIADCEIDFDEEPPEDGGGSRKAA